MINLNNQFHIKQIKINFFKINTPYLNYLNDSLCFYLIKQDNLFQITDDGFIIDEFYNKADFNKLDKLCNLYNTKIINETLLMQVNNKENLLDTINKFIQLIIILDGILRLKNI